jgi:hypothetical protein
MLLLAAAAMTQTTPQSPAPKANSFRPVATASAHATARITVISGVKFGEDYSDVPASARRRSADLTDYDGQVRPAELLEFQ